jgi:drug/metabolite transporter superfamily protein YnfA
MKCPHCHHTFALTWKEYFCEIWGHHNCVACKRRFKLSFSWWYLAIAVLITLIIAGLATFLVVRWTHSRMIATVGGLVIVLVVLLPLDRWLDDHWRKSALLEPDKPET